LIARLAYVITGHEKLSQIKNLSDQHTSYLDSKEPVIMSEPLSGEDHGSQVINAEIEKYEVGLDLDLAVNLFLRQKLMLIYSCVAHFRIKYNYSFAQSVEVETTQLVKCSLLFLLL